MSKQTQNFAKNHHFGLHLSFAAQSQPRIFSLKPWFIDKGTNICLWEFIILLGMPLMMPPDYPAVITDSNSCF